LCIEDERALLKIMIMDGRGKTLDEFSRDCFLASRLWPTYHEGLLDFATPGHNVQ